MSASFSRAFRFPFQIPARPCIFCSALSSRSLSVCCKASPFSCRTNTTLLSLWPVYGCHDFAMLIAAASLYIYIYDDDSKQNFRNTADFRGEPHLPYCKSSSRGKTNRLIGFVGRLQRPDSTLRTPSRWGQGDGKREKKKEENTTVLSWLHYGFPSASNSANHDRLRGARKNRQTKEANRDGLADRISCNYHFALLIFLFERESGVNERDKIMREFEEMIALRGGGWL